MTISTLRGRILRMETATPAVRARVSAVPYGEPDDSTPGQPMTEDEWLARYGRAETSNPPEDTRS